MAQSANIRSLDAVKDFKAALAKFGDQVKQSLISAHSDMRKGIQRLQTDHYTYWQHEEKKWTRKLAEAKSELYRAENESRDTRSSPVLERKAVERAQQRIEECRRKMERVKYWVRNLEKEAALCLSQLQQVDELVQADLPRTAAKVERMMQSIESYLKLQAPETRREAPDGEEDRSA
ncbi:MAG: hypothetical protein EA377_04325 [Phycisphaerales bacterium]|nr:MAG: hypothetical protein EA377_04325 [Phycisphaerales bacterium]